MSVAGRAASGFDEARERPGVPRSHYAGLLEQLEGADLEALRTRVQDAVAEQGATFAGEPFPADPVPRVVEAAEWDALAAGLEQRTRALNAFLLDAYGHRRAVAEGVVPARVIEEAEGFEPALVGRLPATAAPLIGIAGLDVVRDADGVLRVLEDNCRAPSGVTYATALRHAVQRELPGSALAPPRDLPNGLAELLRAAVRDAAPPGAADPVVVVLTDGPYAAARWEHEQVAAMTGASIATVAELGRRGDRLVVRGAKGERTVDVVVRRLDEDRLRDGAGAATAAGELLLEPWLAGTLGLVNGFGTGLADDKLVHAYVEDLVRFHLGEEPLLPSVPTFDLGRPDTLREVLDDLRAYVVKPRGEFGGRGVVVCSHARDDTLRRVRDELGQTPGRFVAQRVVQLSEHPTVVDGCLAPRHVDLRPFVFSGRGWTRTLPGGLTRVAFGEGALVVNSSQDGGGKDTWVLAR